MQPFIGWNSGKMPQNNPDLVAAIVAFFQSIWPSITGGLSAAFITAMRAYHYSGESWKKTLSETALAFSVGLFIAPFLKYLEIDPTFAPAFGAAFGFIGVEAFKKGVHRFFDKMVDK